MDFRPLAEMERRRLLDALRGNAKSDRAILMDQRDTSFVGSSDDATEEEVIFAIKSVPCHYQSGALAPRSREGIVGTTPGVPEGQ